MFLAAASQLTLELVTVVLIGGGFAGCGVLWYFMVVKGGRAEREEAAARKRAVESQAVRDTQPPPET